MQEAAMPRSVPSAPRGKDKDAAGSAETKGHIGRSVPRPLKVSPSSSCSRKRKSGQRWQLSQTRLLSLKHSLISQRSCLWFGLCFGMLLLSVDASTHWSSKDISSGPARGDYPLVVDGGGFDRNNRAFLCVFHSQNFSFSGLTMFSDSEMAQSSEADVLNNNTLNCIAPVWNSAAGSYSFSIFLNNFGLIPFTGSALQRSFTFVEGWIEVGENNPTAGSAKGGSQLSFQGYGLDTASSIYECVFFRMGEMLSSPARVQTSRLLNCEAPAWGEQFFGASDDRRATFGIYSNTSVYLSNGNSEVLWLGDSSGRDFGSSCQARECASFLFFSVWSGVVANQTASDYGFSIAGGESFAVTGYAFAASATYYCSLTSSSNDVAYTAVVTPASPNRIVFTTPRWEASGGVVSVALFLSNSAGQREPGNDTAVAAALQRAANITYDEVWSALQPTSGLSQGGTPVLVSIEGLRSDANRSFACRFATDTLLPNCSSFAPEGAAYCEGGAVYLRSPAAVLNASTLKCVAPEWLRAAGAVPFALLRRFAPQEAWHTVASSLPAGEQRFEFRAEWHRVAGRSAGGERLAVAAQGGEAFAVEGHGFDPAGGGGYVCRFTQGPDRAAASTGTALTPQRMRCEAPAWGLLYGEGSVQLRIERGGSELPLTAVGGAEVAGQVTCGTALCEVEVFAVWGAAAPTRGCATGGSRIEVRGAGFAGGEGGNASRYMCEFAAGGAVSSVAAVVVNSTALACVAEAWTAPQLRVQLSVKNATAALGANASWAAFEFRACWTAKNASEGFARGGQRLQISGSGFDSAVGRYECRFGSGAGREGSAAQFESTQALVCAVPEWQSGAGLVNFSLWSREANGSEVPTDGGDGSLGSFLFLPEWTSFAPTSGPASGGTAVVVAGFGFPDSVDLYCNFSRAGAASLSTAAVWLSNTAVACPTPAWGRLNAAGESAGAAAVSVFQGGVRVGFRSASSPSAAAEEALCAQGAIAGNCSFLFLPVFLPESTLPRAHAAAGGSVVAFEGLGFDAAQQLLCVFASRGAAGERHAVNSSVEVVSVTRAQCEVPQWRFRAALNVSLELLLQGAPVESAGQPVTDLRVTAGVLAVAPTMASAKGGARVTVTGFGFDVAMEPVCTFDGARSRVGLVASSTEIQCTVPAWLQDARVVDFALALGDRNVSAVAPNATLNQGTLYPEARPLPFAFFPEWTRHFPGTVDRLGTSDGGGSPAITVTGFGFDSSQQYRCRIDMFDGYLRTAESDPVYAATPTMLVFEPPEWDLVTPSGLYVTNLTNLSVFELSGSDEWELVFSLNGTTASSGPIRVQQINKIPSFAFLARNVTVQAQATPYSFAIAENIYAGVNYLNAPVASEQDQRVTFLLSVMSAGMFSSGPTLHADGTLSFTVGDNQFGTLHLYVTLADDGGTRYGGVDQTPPQLFHLTVAPTRASPQFELSATSVALSENSGAYTVPGLISAVSTGPTLEFLQTASFSVVADSYFFSAAPTVSGGGDLQFTAQEFAFGTTTLQVVLTAASSSNGSSSTSFSRDLELAIAAVNQAPSFTINASFTEIVLVEDEFGSASPFVLPEFIVDIRAGPNVSDGAGGEDWDESLQQLSFVVIGGSSIFAEGPAVDAAGTLTLTLAESQHGLARFSILLRDDGGNFNGGRDSSRAQAFSVRVLPVNDQPFFAVDCPFENWFLTCSSACGAGDVGACRVRVDVWENCADCEPRNVGFQNCSRSFVAFSFATNVRASALSEEAERNQTLAFQFLPLSNTSFLFDADYGLHIDPASGTLSICLAQDQNGNATFEVSLVDDGGVARGGADTYGPFLLNVVVLPVNQQPTFQLCCGDTLHVWLNSGHTLLEAFATDILRGDRNADGDDSEASASGFDFAQSLTFIVANNLPSAFIEPPHLSLNGTLTFTLVDGFSGLIDVNITLLDDGGTERGGSNVSFQNITLVVSESYLSVTVNGTTGSPAEVQAGIAADLGVRSRMVLAISDTEYLVVATEVTETLRAAQVAFNLTTNAAAHTGNASAMASTWHPTPGTLVVSTQPFLRNYGNVANFTVVNSTVLVTGLSHAAGNPLVEGGFVRDNVEPEHTPLELDGRHVVEFEVTAQRYKAYLNAPTWVSDGTSGGVVGSGPNVTAVCEPECERGVLSLGQGDEAVNGVVEYGIRMVRSNRSEAFYVDAQLVLVLNEDVRVLEDQANTSIACFVSAQYAGVASTGDPFPSVSFSMSPYSPDTMASQLFSASPASDLFVSGPTLVFNNSGCVAFVSDLIADAFGSAWFVVLATQVSTNSIFTIQRAFQFTVLPVNDHPFFVFTCSDPTLGVKCANCSGSADASCEVVLTVNRINTAPQAVVPDPARFCVEAYVLQNFTQNISESMLRLQNEEDQNVSFSIALAANGSSLFVEGWLPVIDAATGTLTFCVALDQDGNATFLVSLHDDGGQDRGGDDTFGPFPLTIVVEPVNQQPSFRLCCGTTLHVWMNSMTFRQTEFVVDILRGNIHRDGNDIELSQSLTFIVASDVPSAFNDPPTLDLNGTLTFTLVDGFSGLIDVNITLIDDGGTERGGINVSGVQNFTLVVSESYLSVTVNGTTGSPAEVQAGIAADLGVQSRMVLAISDTEYLVVATEVAETLRAAQVAFNLTTNAAAHTSNASAMASTWHPAPGTLVVSTQPFLRNYGNVANFTVVNSTVLVTGLSHAAGNPLVEGGFVRDIVEPEHTPLELDGRHVVEFEVTAQQYKAYLNAPTWVSDGTSGGVVGSGPNVTAVCEPECERGVLSLGQGDGAVNGVVEYGIRMVRSNRSEAFYVDAQLVLRMPSALEVLEDQDNSTLPCFVTTGFAGSVPSSGLVLAFLQSRLAGTGNLTVLMRSPIFEARNLTCWDIDIPLMTHKNGNESFVVFATSLDGRHTLELDLTVTVIPVNDAPSFDIPGDVVVPENLLADVAYTFTSAIQDVLPGPEDEVTQRVTFTLSLVSGDEALFSALPHVAADGRLNFTVAQYERGTVRYEVFLADDGGTDNGGSNTSTVQTLTIEVQPANHPPEFLLPSNTTSFLEQDAPALLTRINFATNITPGVLGDTTNLTETDQELTFHVRQVGGNADLFFRPPNISANGTLLVVLAPHQFGHAELVAELRDDGGTLGEGLDTSDPSNFTVVVQPVNDPPRFEIPESVAVSFEIEGEPAKQTLEEVVTHISAGPLEPEQSVTFMVFIHSFRVPDRDSQPWSTDLSALFGLNSSSTDNQLLMPGSNISLSKNGSLSFFPVPLRNGIVNLSCVAVDDGGTLRGGRDASEEAFFSLRIAPVNSEPSFAVPSPVVTMVEEGAVEIPGFATEIVPGGWDEEDQLLYFTLELEDGPAVLFDLLQIECPETGAYACSGGNATLRIRTLPDHFGSVVLNVTLRDGAGTRFGGVDRSALPMTVEVAPVNDVPRFELVAPVLTVAEDTGCFTIQNATAIWTDYLARPSAFECEQAIPLQWSFARFAVVESLGPLEDGPALCPPETACEAQAAQFLVSCRPEWEELLAALPNVTEEGALFLQLRPHVSGSVECRVWLRDRFAQDGSELASAPQNFTVEVIPVNDAPAFNASSEVTVCEDSGPVSLRLALDISTDGGVDTEGNQNLTFTTFFADTEGLFTVDGSPRLSLDGVLSFETAKDMFGDLSLFIQLTDDGGSELGGQDRSRVQEVLIAIQAVNDPPAFATRNLTLVEDAGRTARKVAVNATVGAFNEGCEVSTVFCQDQTYTYRILDLTQPDMFFGYPAINASGVMALELAPNTPGISILTVQLVDDGGTENTCDSGVGQNGTAIAPRGDDSSIIQRFAVAVEPTNDMPDFRLQWNVTCLTGNATCTCRASDANPSASPCASILASNATSLPMPHVTFLNTISGNVVVENFATYITPAQGYLTETRLEHDEANGHTTFADAASTSVLSRKGLEYATDYVISPDRRHLYAVEAERDSMLTMGWSDAPAAAPSFIDRNSDGEDRLRFLPFKDEAAPRRVQGTRAVCGLDAFEHQGAAMLAAASGCDADLERHLPRPSGVCGDAAGKACGPECCEAMLAETVGLWTLNADSTQGAMAANDLSGEATISCSATSCVYARPKNDQACAEEFPVRVEPAAFRDDAFVLGSAVVQPPACKTGSGIDWDREEATFSAQTFIVNDGEAEAVQFDGALNSALTISENIAALVDGTVENSKLPLEELSVEVWFRVNKDDVERAGLVAVQQDGFQCGKGWSLTYSMAPGAGNGQSSTTISFAVSLEGNNFFDYGTLITVSHTLFPALRLGQWVQVVATYDRTRLSLYVDGQLRQDLVACLFPPCGKIVYPAPYHPEGTCVTDGTVFAIGTFINRRTLQSFPHVGAIRRVRILKRALRPNETAALYEDERDATVETTEPDGDYWTRVVGGGGAWSPSLDVSSAGQREEVSMRGQFLSGASYRLRVTSFADSMVSGECAVLAAGAGEEGSDSALAPTAQYGNLLRCTTPEWEYGYRAARMAVERNVTESGGGGGWQRLVQKLCLFDECGFIPWETRTEADWWSAGYRNTIRSGLSGTLSLYRFTTETLLLRFDPSAEEFEEASNFAAVTNCTGRVCAFQQGECTGSALHSVACRSEEDCGGQLCRELPSFRVMGSASVTPCVVNSTRYLLVANFWDGIDIQTWSSLFMLDASNEAHFVQQIATSGARRWEVVRVGNVTFAAVANLVGPSFLYLWTSDDMQPLNTTNGIALNVEGASGLASFTHGASAVLAVAAYSSAAAVPGLVPSKVFQFDFVTSDEIASGVEPAMLVEGGGVTIKEHALETGPVNDVEFMELDGVPFLAFAAADGAPSPVYRISASGEQLHFALIQSVETAHATSLRHFYNRADFLVITQPSSDSIMYRWNGTAFFREPNQLTLPKDSAGGQALPYRNIDAVTTFRPAGGGEESVEYMVLGTFGEAGRAVDASLLLRSEQFLVKGFLNPVSIKMTQDGRHIYVAATIARGIIGFERDNRTGLLQMNTSAGYLTNWTRTLIAGGVPDPLVVDRSERGFPLRGIAQITISADQRNVYAASMLDNTVAVFDRNAVTGELALVQTLEYSRSFAFSGLDGARGVSVSATGETVYVAGWRDQSVSLWARDASDGTLAFLDKVRNGERLVGTFRQKIGDAPAPVLGETKQDVPTGLPFRVGGDGIMSVRAALHVKIAGRDYWVLAHRVDEPEAGVGEVVMWEWTPRNSSVRRLNFTTLDAAPSCLAHFSDAEDGVVADYLVVGNQRTVLYPDAAVNVYRWDAAAEAFLWQHALPQPTDLHSEFLYASALKPFTIGARRFLAVANLREEVAFFVPSVVYEFQQDAADRTADGAVDLWMRGEFRQFQLLPTNKGVDVDVAETNGRLLLLLAHGPVVGAGSTAQPGRVDVFEFDAAADAFQLLQSISSPGVNDVEPLHIPGAGLLLALANRQVSPLEPGEDGDLSVYDEPSLLLRFDEASAQFAFWQTLGADFRSVAEDAAAPFDVNRFCGGRCAVSGDGATRTVAALRGATSFTAFMTGGEVYLAVAQSVCDVAEGARGCGWAQPKSAVLQWNRREERFGEMLALTDQESERLQRRRVPAHDLAAHAFALRVEAGMAMEWTFVEAEGRPMLLQASLSHGAVLREFVFRQLDAMQGPVSAAADAADRQLFVASDVSASVATFRRRTAFDHLGQPKPLCAAKGCLEFDTALSDQPLPLGAWDVSQPRQVEGLAGAREVQTRPGSCAAGPCTLVAVRGNLPRDELRCGAVPPVGVALSPDRASAACQEVRFELEAAGGEGAALFEGGTPPRISSDGTLVTGVERGRVGTATYNVRILDSEGSEGRFVSQVRFEVRGFNQAPFFSPFDIVTNERTLGPDGADMAFAAEVSAGLNEDYQELTWQYTVDATPGMFGSSFPELRVVTRANSSSRDGVLTFPPHTTLRPGIATFNLTLIDDGASNAASGDINESPPGSFTIVIRAVNQQPSFELTSESIIIEEGRQLVIPGFAVNVTTGDEGRFEQTIQFSLFEVLASPGAIAPPDAASLFDAFAVDELGTLSLRSAAGWSGFFRVGVQIRDSGGTAGGGLDSALREFSLQVVPASQVPRFASPAALQLVEASSALDSAQHFPALFEVLSPDLTLNPDLQLAFRVVDVSAPQLFAELPAASPDGNVSFALAIGQSGESRVQVLLEVQGNFSSDVPRASPVSTLTLAVDALNAAPFFTMMPSVRLVQSAEPIFIDGFARNISAGRPSESGQALSFEVAFAAPPNFFLEPPQLAVDGTLRLLLHPEALLTATIFVTLRDDGGVAHGGVDSFFRQGSVLVLEKPVIERVFPALLRLEGGALLTLTGKFQGTQERPTSLTVTVGAEQCSHVQLVSETEVRCRAPAGMGRQPVQVTLAEGSALRVGAWSRSVRYGHVLSGGAAPDGSRGFIGVGPAGAAAGTVDFPGASVEDSGLSISRGVSSLQWFQGLLYAGGGFEAAGGLRVGSVMAWDSEGSRGLGRGVDGSVEGMCVFEGRLVVVGTFSRALNAGGGAVLSGGVAVWDGGAWESLGGRFRGTATAVSCSAGRVVVGGRVERVGELRVSGMAQFGAASRAWGAVGDAGAARDGVKGGEVYALLDLGGDLFVGGSFASAGGVRAAKAAVYRGGVFEPLGSFNGDVRCFAASGDTVFVGGEFTSIDGRPFQRIAVLKGARFEAVGEAVSAGSVQSLLFTRSCLYAGGAFPGFAARWCRSTGQVEVDDMPGAAAGWQRREAVEGFAGFGPVQALAVAFDSD